MGCGGSRPNDLPEQAGAPVKPGLSTPPLPNGHHLLVGLAKALDLQEGTTNEAGAVETWVTLELEARPSEHLTELGTSLQPCIDFVAEVEAAVKNKTVTTAELREHWGCPSVEPKRPPMPSGPVSLSDVTMTGPDEWRLRPDAPRVKTVSATDNDGSHPDDDSSRLASDRDDDLDDDLDDLDDDMRRDEPNPDGLGGGDGRYR